MRANDLGKDSMPQLILRLAVPAMVAQFVSVLYGIVDRMYIGNIAGIGELALAGVGVCGPVTTLMGSFTALVGVGGATLLSIRMGEKNQRGAEKILANGFLMLIVLSALIMACMWLFHQPLLRAFGASEVSLPYASCYLNIYTAGTAFSLLSIGLNYFIVCQGYATVGMLTVLVGALLNIVLDPLFIFAFGMDVAGAAWATVISQAASCGFVLWFLLSHWPPVRITWKQYDLRTIGRIFTFGLSPFVIIATDSVLLIVLNMVLQRYGGAERGDMLITCATVVQSYMMLITMPLGGITGGTQGVLSYNYGAKNTARIRQGIRWIVSLCLLFTGVMFVVSRIVPQAFVYLFTRDTQYMALSVWGIRIFTLAIIPLAVQYTLVDALTALGITRVSVCLSLFRKTTFLVSTLVLPVFFGAEAAFYAEPVCDIAGTILSTTVFLLLFNRLMKKREAMPEDQALYA